MFSQSFKAAFGDSGEATAPSLRVSDELTNCAFEEALRSFQEIPQLPDAPLSSSIHIQEPREKMSFSPRSSEGGDISPNGPPPANPFADVQDPAHAHAAGLEMFGEEPRTEASPHGSADSNDFVKVKESDLLGEVEEDGKAAPGHFDDFMTKSGGDDYSGSAALEDFLGASPAPEHVPDFAEDAQLAADRPPPDEDFEPPTRGPLSVGSTQTENMDKFLAKMEEKWLRGPSSAAKKMTEEVPVVPAPPDARETEMVPEETPIAFSERGEEDLLQEFAVPPPVESELSTVSSTMESPPVIFDPRPPTPPRAPSTPNPPVPPVLYLGDSQEQMDDFGAPPPLHDSPPPPPELYGSDELEQPVDPDYVHAAAPVVEPIRDPSPPPSILKPSAPPPPPPASGDWAGAEPFFTFTSYTQDPRESPSSESAVASTEPESPSHSLAGLEEDEIPPEVVDIVYWRDPKKSAAVFAIKFIALICLANFSLISVVAYTGLLLLGLTVSFRVYQTAMGTLGKGGAPGEPNPLKKYLDSDLSIPDDRVHAQVDVFLKHAKDAGCHLRRILLVEDVVETLKFGVLLWALTYIGAWFSGVTLMLLALIAAFTVPKVYELYQPQIDEYWALAAGHIKTVSDQVEEKLPFLKKKQS